MQVRVDVTGSLRSPAWFPATVTQVEIDLGVLFGAAKPMTSFGPTFAASLCLLMAIADRSTQIADARQGAVQQGDANNSKVRATLLINSGEPDPTWDLGGTALKTLRHLLKDLPPAKPADWQQPGGLGYRGIRLTNAGIADLPDAVHVYRGVVEVQTGGKVEYFKVTKEKNLEAFLLDWYDKGKNTM